MTIDSFFESLYEQYQNKLPFVVYSRPINSIIKCWLQKDDVLHTTSNFTESGFVFAPFDLSNKSIVFPVDSCEHQSIEISQLLQDSYSNTTLNDIKKQEHLELVSKGIKAITNGNLKKVVLSRKVQKENVKEHPLDIFKRLFNTYKNAMVYCWYHPKVGLWLGATPELLFKVEGKQLTTISLAGTQPQNGKKAVWSEKEYEEQQIVTDYIVDQVKPHVSSINVSKTNTVSAGNLLHLKTYVTSLVKDANLKSIVEALHPTPAVCGFPKAEAKEFILHNENYDRAYYTGFLGELNLKQSKTRNPNRRNVENSAYGTLKTVSNFYVNLRCMQLIGTNAIVYVGGGITKDSDPEKEWLETVNKTKTINNILG